MKTLSIQYSMKKKTLLIVAALAILSLPRASAQEETKPEFPRHYVQFNLGDPIINMALYGGFGMEDCVTCYRGSSVNWFRDDTYTSSRAVTPTLSFSYFYAIKPWLHLGGEVHYAGDYYAYRNRITNKYLGSGGYTSLGIMPAIRFQYLNKRLVGLYSGLAFGLHIIIDNEAHIRDREYSVDFEFMPGFQLTALGVRVGNKVFGTAEIGVGQKGILTLGVGARF